jgi:hypothetical protein
MTGGHQMYVERGREGQVLAAYVDQQYSGQQWLPIESQTLQAFLAAAPVLAKAPVGRRELRRVWRSARAVPAYS